MTEDRKQKAEKMIPASDFCLLTSVLLFLVLSCPSCGQKEEHPSASVSKATETPTFSQQESTNQIPGTLKGKVFFEGEVPATQAISFQGNPECLSFHSGEKSFAEDLLVKEGMLQNVFVYVKEGLEGQPFEVPQEPAAIENLKCVYVPHVTGVQVQQPVVLWNRDPTLHNIHSYSKNSPGWNLGLPIQGMKVTKKFTTPEIMVSLKCDVHPWMNAYIGVLAHPCFSVTTEDGSFGIKKIPPGEYLIEAWHEKLGTQSQKLKVASGETREIEFRFKSSSATVSA